jgi:hypothetical protein
MKDALNNILKVLMQNGAFLAQISADVSALKTVVSALGPEVRAALDEQVEAQRRKVEPIVQEQMMLLEVLRQGISRIPN